MISMALSKAATAIGTHFQGEDVTFYGCSTDSRKLEQGNLFIALKGENFDGHDYVSAAEEKGACSLMFEHDVPHSLPSMKVADTRKAMGLLARAWREEMTIPVVAITGSNGKTTVKEMVTSILSEVAEVHATKGNLNNDIGVPLTLLRLNEKYQYGVIELGANGMGEIAYTTSLVEPDVVLITNIGDAHIEGFGSIEGVARAKSEIFEGLKEKGTAVVNLNEKFSTKWLRTLRGKNVVTVDFKPNPDANIYLENLSYEEGGYVRFWIKLPFQAVQINLPLLGRHNAENAVLAAAAAHACGASSASIKKGLEQVEPVKGRLCSKKSRLGKLIIDDSYNANPSSMNVAIDVLKNWPKNKVLIMGDMGELGEESAAYHEAVGKYAADNGINRLIAVGKFSPAVAAGFGDGARIFSSNEELKSAMTELLDEADVILVKGSRAAEMEVIVNYIVDRF